MSTRFRDVACLTLVLVACGKKNAEQAESKKVEASAVTTPTAATPPPADKPADPTSGWQEQKGPGFTLRAPNAPKEQQLTVPTAVGPVPAVMWTGYESGGEAMWAVASEDFSAAKKIDVETVVNRSFDGLLGKLPGAKIDEIKAITDNSNAPIGKELRATANLQGHETHLHVLALYSSAQKHFFMVQALSGTDTTLADKFVDSFKLTN